MNLNSDNSVSEIIEEILTVVDVNSIVYVDDIYSEDAGASVIIGWLAEAIANEDSEKADQLLPDIALQNPENVWKQELTRYYDNLSKADRDSLVKDLSETLGKEDYEKDLETLSTLETKLLNTKIFKGLTPNDWDNQKEKIISESVDKGVLLCLFDRNLQHSEDYYENSGIDLLKNAIEIRRKKIFTRN